ncbi:MAG: helix-turn-helix transcriptional regulator [Rhizobiales bacterium]|nr:helix-turn-helix transcriptional regulator [Hyphomicrobiales bacterium]
MSQTQLAELCDCSVATISRLETGDPSITLQTLETVAEVFGTDALTLQMRGPNDEDDIGPYWARADAKERKQILSIVKTIVNES